MAWCPLKCWNFFLQVWNRVYVYLIGKAVLTRSAVSILPPACSQILFQGRNENQKIIVFKTSRIVESLLRQPSIKFIPWNVRTNCCSTVDRLEDLKVWPLSLNDIKSYSGRNPELSDAASNFGLCPVVPGDPEDHLGHFCRRYACSCLCSWNWASTGQFLPLPPVCLNFPFPEHWWCTARCSGDILVFGVQWGSCVVMPTWQAQWRTEAFSPAWDQSTSHKVLSSRQGMWKNRLPMKQPTTAAKNRCLRFYNIPEVGGMHFTF